MACPRCATAMDTDIRGQVHVHQCPEGHGVFLERADVGELADAETAFHRGAANATQPLPRMTADMVVPPTAVSRSSTYVETLFS